VALAALTMHLRTFAFGFVDLDDRDLIVDDHASLVGPGALARLFGRSYLAVVDAGHAYYRPLVTASYALDARMWGVDPHGYHLTNTAIYGAAAALVYALLSLTRVGSGVALAGALAFAVHPALVPAVAWIPGRNDALLALFALGAWVAFAVDRERPARRWKVAHLALFAAAMGTKETAAVLPWVWMVHAWALPGPGERRDGPPRGGSRWTAYAVGWTVVLGLRAALKPPDSIHLAEGLRSLPSLLLASLGQIVLPLEPTAIAVARDVPVGACVGCAGALGAAILLARGARRRVAALGLATFVASLVPVAMTGGTLLVGCRLVLPACGVLLVVGEILRALPIPPRSLAAGGVAVVTGLAAMTAGSEAAYRDPRRFATAMADASPHCALAHVCLGRSLQAAGDDDRALAEYAAALALAPAEVVHNNVAVVYMKQGRWADAEREIDAEIAINPRYGRAHRNRAAILRHEERLAEACAAARRARALSGEPVDDAIADEERIDCAPPP
jgi:protein O-mannosyl-transferase